MIHGDNERLTLDDCGLMVRFYLRLIRMRGQPVMAFDQRRTISPAEAACAARGARRRD